MMRPFVDILLAALLGGALLAALWEGLARVAAYAFGRWAESQGIIEPEDPMRVFSKYDVSVERSMMSYVISDNGQLLNRFASPSQPLGFYDADFILDMPPETQAKLARELLRRYGLEFSATASSQAPGDRADLETLGKILMRLVAVMALAAERGAKGALLSLEQLIGDPAIPRDVRQYGGLLLETVRTAGEVPTLAET